MNSRKIFKIDELRKKFTTKELILLQSNLKRQILGFTASVAFYDERNYTKTQVKNICKTIEVRQSELDDVTKVLQEREGEGK